jgi:hypothetical protein
MTSHTSTNLLKSVLEGGRTALLFDSCEHPALRLVLLQFMYEYLTLHRTTCRGISRVTEYMGWSSIPESNFLRPENPQEYEKPDVWLSPLKREQSAEPMLFKLRASLG